MGPLTDYVLDRALAAASGWHRSGHRHRHQRQPRHLQPSEADLPAPRADRAAPQRLPPAKLTLEITETAAVDDSVDGRARPAALRELGVALSVDDFGTGHSSLIRLARVPDLRDQGRPLLREDMHTAERPIVATAIQLAHSLGLRVVAEGVEDQLTLDALASSAATSRRATSSRARCPRSSSPAGSTTRRSFNAPRAAASAAALGELASGRSLTERWCSA